MKTRVFGVPQTPVLPNIGDSHLLPKRVTVTNYSHSSCKFVQGVLYFYAGRWKLRSRSSDGARFDREAHRTAVGTHGSRGLC
jgi:hypothetical protein